ncbi:lasso peptide biosynthesis protein [Micromonospora sp. CPCC 206060]|uniref:lasso peptide biosynthesis protein n=1 Tax=Micromonospora sp. CPCC 206060 TaxID=3122406 RepID=UPI002FEEC965
MNSGSSWPEQLDLDDPLRLVECPAGPPPTGLRPLPPGGELHPDQPVRPAPGVHWADCDGELVALDLNTDRFVALGPYASTVATAALTSTAPPPADPQDRAVLDSLAERGLLVSGNGPVVVPATATRPGGVATYTPRPRAGLTEAAHVVPPGPALLATATRHLRECDRQARSGGLLGLTVRLRRDLATAPSRRRPFADPYRLVQAQLTVRRLLPQALHPMAPAAALARHAWQAGLPAVFVIGVQKFPFHTRAYVECDGRVLDDAQELREVLAPVVVLGPPAVPMMGCP